MKTCFWTALIIVLLSSTIVILLMHKPVWIELETLALVIGLMMTFFYSYILYHGVKFLDDGAITVSEAISNISKWDFLNSLYVDNIGDFSKAGASEDPMELLIGLFLDILFSLLLTFILGLLSWFGGNLVATSIIIITIPLFYIFTRSIRFVMRHVEECRGKVLKSIQYGLGYALLKTTTLCIMIFAAHQLANLIKMSIFGGAIL